MWILHIQQNKVSDQFVSQNLLWLNLSRCFCSAKCYMLHQSIFPKQNNFLRLPYMLIFSSQSEVRDQILCCFSSHQSTCVTNWYRFTICWMLTDILIELYDNICSATLFDTTYCYLNINSHFKFVTCYSLGKYPNIHQLQAQTFASFYKLWKFKHWACCYVVVSDSWSQLSLWGCYVLKAFQGHKHLQRSLGNYIVSDLSSKYDT